MSDRVIRDLKRELLRQGRDVVVADRSATDAVFAIAMPGGGCVARRILTWSMRARRKDVVPDWLFEVRSEDDGPRMTWARAKQIGYRLVKVRIVVESE